MAKDDQNTTATNPTPVGSPTAAPILPNPNTQTSAGMVKLEMHPKQGRAKHLELDGHKLEKGGAPIEVSRSEADTLLKRRDENGHKYVQEAAS